MQTRAILIAALCGGCVAAASAQPRFIAIPGAPTGVSNGGNVVVGSNGENTFRWTLSGTTATFTMLPGGRGGTVGCSADGSVVVSDMDNGEAGSLENGYAPENRLTGRWTSATGFQPMGIFTTFPFQGIGTPVPPGFLNTPSGISEDGRFAAGLGYSIGDPFTAFRAFRADSLTGTFVPMPQMGGQGSRATCLSGNGFVVGGWDRSPTSSVNRPAIWRVDPMSGTVSEYVFDSLNDDFGEIGALSFDGAMAAGSSTAFPETLIRWDWDGTTYVPTSLGSIGGNVSVTGMTRDGSIIIGNSGSFFFGQTPFIWTAETGMISLLQYLVDRGVTGLDTTFGVGTPLAISPDGSALTIGGFGSPSGVVLLAGGPACVELAEVEAPNLTTISACDPLVILNVSVTGSGPFTYQWRKAGVNLTDGDTGTGSSIFGSNNSQLFVSNASPADVGMYDCVVSNACSMMTSSIRDVGALPPGPYDTCAAAYEQMGSGFVELDMCGAYVNEAPASCVQGTQQADVWIRFTPMESGDYRITTCGQPSYDTILTTYDTCGGPETACSGDFCFSLANIDRITLTAGQPILVRLGVGFAAPPAPVRVTFELAPPAPANDLCAQATDISGAGDFPFNSLGANVDGTSSCGFDTGRDVWFRFTPAENATGLFNTCSTFFDTVLAVYDACNGNEIGCNDSAFEPGCDFQSIVRDVPLSAGVPVIIRVAGSGQDTGGAGILRVELGAPLCPADFNDDGNVDPDDLGDFINCYFGEPPCDGADFNNDGNIDPDDLGDFINVYFAGCP
ncbi:MAG: immunoglobulin domain-containing protein [Phycisphaerales bacterium]